MFVVGLHLVQEVEDLRHHVLREGGREGGRKGRWEGEVIED